jgi:hypothetical protein
MPGGKMKHLQMVVGRIYNLLKKEAAYGPNMQHLEDFRAAQKLERSLDGQPADGSNTRSRVSLASKQNTGREVR